MNLFSEAIYSRYLSHSKGDNPGKYKYLYVKNGRYVYPDDLEKADRAAKQEAQIRSAHQGDIARSKTVRPSSSGTKYGTNAYDKQNSKNGTTINTRAAFTPPSKEEKKETPKTTSTTTPATEEKKTDKDKDTKKKETSKKSDTKKSSTSTRKKRKTNTNSASATSNSQATSQEAQALGLTDADIAALETSIDSTATDRDTVIKNLALKVIRGDFGNGQDRKNKLGKYYTEIQNRVNQLMKEMGSKKKSQTTLKQADEYTNDVLMHYGVLGMKWGVRRYQNADGSLTELGKRRMGIESAGDSDADKRKVRMSIHTNVAADNKGAATALNASSQAARTGSNMARKSANKTRQKMARSLDVSNMSDQDLQRAVNRMNLERNYKNLKTQDVVTGRDYAADILETAGDVASIAASAATIAGIIYLINR